MEPLELLVVSLADLDQERSVELAREILAEDQASALSVIQASVRAMRLVGERYERQEYYLSGLVMAGEIFKEVISIAQPSPEQTSSGEFVGTIVLGTVAGDIHDIGKNLFAISLRAFGFNVIDLGVDVSTERFLEEAMQRRPQVICLSGLITGAFSSMKETVAILRAHDAELGYAPPVVLGGGTVDGAVCRYVGADSWSKDAMEGVRICRGLVDSARNSVEEHPRASTLRQL